MAESVTAERELVDRVAEAEQLRTAQERPPALVVVSGRRRVGKSFLLAAALRDVRLISFQADEQDERGQLSLLAQEAARLLPGAPPIAFDTWDAALAFLEAQAEAPLTVVLDEFQWLCAARPALPSMIQRRWDGWQRAGRPITLVLCGSALSFMEGLLAQDSALHGRATLRLRLGPLDYRQAAAFAPGANPKALVRRFAVLGGTPQYQSWAGAAEPAEVVRTAILRKGAPMYEEPLQLLRQGESIRTPATYLSVLRAIAGGATRHNEIAQAAGLTTQNLSEKLGRLRDLGYVAPRQPVGPGEERARMTYALADPFFRFWFRFVFPNRSRLERGRVDEVAAEVARDFEAFLGPVFEDCCRAWLGRYASEREVGPIQEIGAWWSRDGRAEIDVVALHRGRVTIVGSCKWRSVVDVGVLDELVAARARMARAARARLALFARDDFTAEVRSRADRDGVLLATAKDLFG